MQATLFTTGADDLRALVKLTKGERKDLAAREATMRRYNKTSSESDLRRLAEIAERREIESAMRRRYPKIAAEYLQARADERLERARAFKPGDIVESIYDRGARRPILRILPDGQISVGVADVPRGMIGGLVDPEDIDRKDE